MNGIDVLAIVVALASAATAIVAVKSAERASVASAKEWAATIRDDREFKQKMMDRMLSACGLSLKAREIEAEVEKTIAEGTGRSMQEVRSERDNRFDGVMVPGEGDSAGGFPPIA